MTTHHLRTVLVRAGAGLLVSGMIAAVPVLAAPAGGEERPPCSKENAGGSSAKKCADPSPTTTPTATTTAEPTATASPTSSPTASPSASAPAGTEVGCRDIEYGEGQYRAPVGALGSVLEFQLTLAAPSCVEVLYTVIARDAFSLAELARFEQEGNGITADLVATFVLPEYGKDCIAVDVVVSEGDVVHDVAPNSRDAAAREHCDLHRDGSGPQSWN